MSSEPTGMAAIDQRLSRFARVLIAHAMQVQDEVDALDALGSDHSRRSGQRGRL